jgi:hypothetical protein
VNTKSLHIPTFFGGENTGEVNKASRWRSEFIWGDFVQTPRMLPFLFFLAEIVVEKR